ncbi:type II toxin-antitoxin system VapC family toxin [Candidatus Leptofilum sp.]|uniref:type II toxin-antitoxin system VapC family toxin n=1 Tax=Candidatus Leptofilum sp. TaxID=3241576 RepID=UPI003B5BBF47
MIVYLDASALVKRYVQELGTVEVNQLIVQAEAVGTSIISRAETAAALAKAYRLSVLSQGNAEQAVGFFREEWPSLIRVQLSETVVRRADFVAWEHSLRGFDAVHLASALLWQEQLNQELLFATFDRSLWLAAQQSKLVPFPQDLSPFLAKGRKNG